MLTPRGRIFGLFLCFKVSTILVEGKIDPIKLNNYDMKNPPPETEFKFLIFFIIEKFIGYAYSLSVYPCLYTWWDFRHSPGGVFLS